MTQITYTNYSRLALRTESPIEDVTKRISDRPDRFVRLIHASLGLCSEVQELQESFNDFDDTNTTGELGDSWWFLNNGYRAMNCEVDYASLSVTQVEDYKDVTLSFLFDELKAKIADFQDHVKAHLFYGRADFKVADKILSASVVLIGDLNAVAVVLAHITRNIAKELGEDPVLAVLTANIAKLRARYPEAYSDLSANERSDNTERQAIESSNA